MLFETPKWATTILVHQALKHGKYRKRPTMIFKKGRHWHGHYNPAYNEIVIFTPHRTKKTDTFTLSGEQLVLHEIAHWLVRPKLRGYSNKRYWHDKRFYRKVFRLCKEYNLSYADYKSEFWYKPRASKKAFSQIYKCSWL